MHKNIRSRRTCSINAVFWGMFRVSSCQNQFVNSPSVTCNLIGTETAKLHNTLQKLGGNYHLSSIFLTSLPLSNSNKHTVLKNAVTTDAAWLTCQAYFDRLCYTVLHFDTKMASSEFMVLNKLSF